jgi:heme A synthase
MSKDRVQPDQQALPRFRKLLLATAIMVYLLIVIGGIVRVTGSGLGCPDWPRCFGEWIPPLRADAIIEYTHRLVATLTSPLILASAFVAWWRFRNLRLLSYPLLSMPLLLAVQGLLGGLVVFLETPPNLVAVHLTIAFIIQALIVLPTVLASISSPAKLSSGKLEFSRSFERHVLYLLITIFLMILSGALVVGSNSTYACSGWPLCNGQLIPSNANAWLHMFHRFMVLMASLVLIRVYFLSRADTHKRAASQASVNILVALFMAQATVGALKVSFAFPVWLLGLHVALASAVWVGAVVLATLAAFSEKTIPS